MVDFGQDIMQFVLDHGPAALFFMLLLDSAMILPFVPGELMLVVAVQQFAHDRVSLAFIILVATLGTTAGSLLLYGIARGGGRAFIQKHPRLFLMSPETRDKLERTFSKPVGQSLVFFMRLFPFTRILVSLPAGLAKMPLLRFTILTFLGNLVFNGGVMYVTYEARQPDSQVAGYVAVAKDRYLEPLWFLVLANWLIVSATVLVLALVSVIIRAARAARDPYRAKGTSTALGTLAQWLLIGIGTFIFVGLWTDPNLVFAWIAAAGFDLEAYFPEQPLAPYFVAAMGGILFLLLGLIVMAIRRRSAEFIEDAKRRKKALETATAAEAPPSE